MNKKSQRYKIIATVSWEFETEDTKSEATQYAEYQLNSLLSVPFDEPEFDNFSTQINLAKLKNKIKPIHIAEFSIEEVLPFIDKTGRKKKYVINGKPYYVRMNSDRYYVFLKNIRCSACNLEGEKMILEHNPLSNTSIFNLYGVENNKLVLMTKDHVVAKSKGGKDSLENYQNMCHICNNLKGNYDLTLDQVLELRNFYKNKDKLTKKEYNELLRDKREEMMLENRR